MRLAILLISLLLVVTPAYSLTLLEMTTGVRYYLEEDSAYYFDSSEVQFYVNRAQHAVCNLVVDDALVELTNVDTFSVTLNTYNQSLPTSYLRVKNVFLNEYKANPKHSSEIWSVMPNNKKGESVSASNPFYTVYDNNLRLYPLQTSAGTYEVWYIAPPTELTTDDQECELKDEIQHLIIMLAAVYGLKKDGEVGKADKLLEQINFETQLINRKYGETHLLDKNPVQQ